MKLKHESADTVINRSPLAAGRKYCYKGFPSGITIRRVMLRGHAEDDGGASGVSISWNGFPNRKGSVFVACHSEADFFSKNDFRYLVDA